MSEVVLHEDDDVAVLTQPREAIPAGHKVARRDLPAGTEVHKYGQVIGRDHSRRPGG